MNKAILCGRLGTDPELTYITNGTAVCKFPLATSTVWVDQSGQKQEKVEWHRIVVWGKQGENCAKYLNKGREVLVDGEIEYKKYTDKQNIERFTTDIKAFHVEFLGSGNNSNKPATQNEQQPTNQRNGNRSAPGTSLDEIPF